MIDCLDIVDQYKYATGKHQKESNNAQKAGSIQAKKYIYIVRLPDVSLRHLFNGPFTYRHEVASFPKARSWNKWT